MMRKTTRTIQVFEDGPMRVEVEGNTISAQIVDPTNTANRVKFVIPLPIAMAFSELLNKALCQSGEVVNEVSVIAANRG